MKRRLLILAVLLIGPRWAFADIQADGSNIFTIDSKTVAISTNCAAPTQICTVDPFITRTWVINQSSFTNVFVSSVSTNISTNSFSVPNATLPASMFTPDGPTIPFWGQMFACSSGTVTTGPIQPQTVSILRLK